MNKSVFMQYNTDYISGVMSLRKPQEFSLKVLEDILKNTNLVEEPNIENCKQYINDKYPIFTDFERSFISLTFALATGVGKTRLMGAFITYLYTNYNIKNFLVVAPSTTIYEKLKKDLGNPENSKYIFKGLGCFKNPPRVVADDDFNRTVAMFDSDITIYVYNISKFDKENTKFKAFSEILGMSFYDQLAKMKDLVIIMDESHHYRADKGMETINNLNPILGLELTATPIVNVKNKQIPFKNVVYEYPLSEAIKDGYTRVPFAVTRTDIDFYNFGDDELDKLMLNDGILCHKRIKEKLEYYSRTTKKPLIKPFMLVVCKDTEHASKIEKYIKSDNFENGLYKFKTITINSKMSSVESEVNTKLLLDVEKVDNPIEIVIHVNMLKEGWDVNNLYTIVPLRTASSKILREQMVGRGLRLPYGERTGNKEIDSVMLTAHDKFKEIIEEAQKGDSIFNKGNIIKAEDLENEKIIFTQMSLEYPLDDELCEKLVVREESVKYGFANKINDLLIKNVENFTFSCNDVLTNEGKNQIKNAIESEIKKDRDLGEIFDENRNPIEHWINENIIKTHEKILSKFILIPKIKTEREEGEYYFDDFNLNLSKFNQQPIENEIIIRNLLDSSDEEKINNGYITFDISNPNKTIVEELRKKAEINYEKNSELLFKLIRQLTNYFEQKFGTNAMKNIVMMYKREIASEIYSQMLKHFVRNEGLIKEEVFSDSTINLQSNYSYTIVKNIFDSYNSNRDGKITSILFNGIKRGVFSSAKFDSEPELILARQFEREEEFVCTWLRPSPNEFNITYNGGKRYEPDFVVETKSIIYLVEVKADNKLDDDDVLAKQERAVSYCELVSKWADSTNNKKWKYVLIPSSKINANSTFKHLTEQYKVN